MQDAQRRRARIPALFEPFRRGPERRGNGSGLGLAVVRASTLTHHSEVTATRRPGGGFTVRVELPRGAWNGPTGPAGSGAAGIARQGS
ncbi:ATP-binding protein [Streptomyces sp. NPDC004296]|uniref:ATP-binding protein n=1 Tax=Streptomyces sp. NPDC004296 TaxID=3364697 RepID=UPI003680B243